MFIIFPFDYLLRSGSASNAMSDGWMPSCHQWLFIWSPDWTLPLIQVDQSLTSGPKMTQPCLPTFAGLVMSHDGLQSKTLLLTTMSGDVSVFTIAGVEF
ncbi:hypothetical protein TH468_13605 [Thalassospira sp. MCCC 1A03138]|nr:hypothetical protein TH468_13605 [Thalassospira sp. MCCC 1A03138]